MRSLYSFFPFIIAGIFVGLLTYTAYISRAYSYLSDDPSACVNCHIMSSYYQSWEHSSHAVWATCNDCHVPQDNILSKYFFKGIDGIYHAAVFTVRMEPQVIRPRDASNKVIMKNCIRCHTELNTELVNTGTIAFKDIKKGEGKLCWDCHRNVPHTTISNLASTTNVIVPYPSVASYPNSHVPEWLNKLLIKDK